MARLGIGTGTTPNDGTGDTLLTGAVKINSNFSEVYGIIGDGTNPFVGIVTQITAGDNISISTSHGAVTVTGTASTDNIRAGTLVVSGVSTLGVLTGVTAVSAVNYYGDGSALTGIAGTADINADKLTVSGVSTFTNQVKILSSDSTPGRVDYYCESGNAHYTRVQAPPHATYSGNNTVILPVSSGTLLNEDGNGSNLTGIVTGITAGSNVTISGSTGVVTINATGGGGGGTGSLAVGAGKTDGEVRTIGTGVSHLHFVGTGYTVIASAGIATVQNLGMGMTTVTITSVGYGATVNAGSQISYTATASDANAKFHIESAPSGIGQIGINYDSGVMGGGQNATAGTYTVKLRAATFFGLSESKDVSFTVSPFTLSMDTMFGDPTTFVMMTDDNDDATYVSLSTGGVVSYDGANYVIDRTNANYSTATKHALYYDNTNNVLYGFRTNSSNNAISGIYKWTSVSSASHGTNVGSGSAQQNSSWATSDAVSENSALASTKTYTALTLDASIADFDGAYTRQSFKANLDTGTVSSGNALFNADDGYWWFLKDGDNSRMIIYSTEDSAWAYVYVNGADFSSAANNTAVGSANGVETQSITGVVYDDRALQPEAEDSEISYSGGALATAGYQPGGNYTHTIGGAFAMKIETTGGIMNNFGTNDTDWAYGFTLEDPWLVTGAANQLLAPESNSDGWHNFGLALFNISTTEYDYICYGANGYGPYNSSIFSGSFARLSNTNAIANAGDTVQVRFDGTTNGYYYVYINGVQKIITSSPDTYMSATNTTNPTLTFGDTSNQNGGTIVNDYSMGQPWPFRIRDLWIANNGNISASDLTGVATLNDRNVNTWSEYSDVDVYITMNSSGVTAVKGSPTVTRKTITFS